MDDAAALPRHASPSHLLGASPPVEAIFGADARLPSPRRGRTTAIASPQ